VPGVHERLHLLTEKSDPGEPYASSDNFGSMMPTTREIDQKAQNIFNDSLPDWLIRKQDPDVHVDYFVEIAERSKPSGMIFGVQLKGTNSPRYSKSLIKISIKTKHLSYYLDKVKQPIFLIVVDIKKRQGFWFFIQEWAKEELKKRNWRDQKKIDIKIPLRNSLSDVSQLRAEVAKAEIFMRDLWPSSIPAAIQYEKEALEKLDRRVQVDISYQGGKTRYSLQAREPFNFDIQFRGSTRVQVRFADLFNRGKPAIFDIDEIIEVKGSPLLQSVFERREKGKLLMTPEKKIQTLLIISALDESYKEKIALYGVEGMIWAGIKEARFQGGLKETPLNIELTFPLPPSLGSNPLTVNFSFESSAWQDIPVLRLPHFERLKAFFTAVQEGCLIRIICEIKGNHIFTATSQNNFDHRFMELTSWHLQLLERIRIIAREMNINPIYPKDGLINNDETETIFLLHELIRSGKHLQNAGGVEFRGKLLPNDNFFKMTQNKDIKKLSGPLVIEPKDQKFTLFGKEFEFYPLRYTLTNPILLTDLSEITRDKMDHAEGIDVRWSGGDESELIITRL
jgi:hypothetical protein